MIKVVFILILFLNGLEGALKGDLIAIKANKILGTKYVWGGNSMKHGLDCSALVQQIYKKLGYSLPRTAESQATKTKECPMIRELSNTMIGDALYFKNSKGKIHHVAIVSGFDKYGRPMITHAKGKKYGVVRERLTDKYISEFIGAKRFWDCRGLKKNTHKRYLRPIIIKTAMN